MPKSERRELRLTPEMAEAIDQARGDVPFNRWAERAFEKALAGVHIEEDDRGLNVEASVDPGTPASRRALKQAIAAPGSAFNRATSLKR